MRWTEWQAVCVDNRRWTLDFCFYCGRRGEQHVLGRVSEGKLRHGLKVFRVLVMSKMLEWGLCGN
jgi:hypothetical protein